MTQLHLPISLEPNATFNNFYCSNNYTATMVHQLMDTEKPIVLCGKSGSGKTHLLHAICHQTPLRWLYLDCNNHKLTSPDILDNMEEKCVCLDNIHALAHVKKWEDGLFKLMLHHHRLVLSTQPHVAMQRHDLQSRILAMNTFDLPELSEQDQHRALLQRSQRKGLPISNTVITWMQRHLPRNNQFLFDFIDQMEAESLRRQQKATIHLARIVWDNMAIPEKTNTALQEQSEH